VYVGSEGGKVFELIVGSQEAGLHQPVSHILFVLREGGREGGREEGWVGGRERGKGWEAWSIMIAPSKENSEKDEGSN
jgi:hypothetical protein